MAYLAVRRLKYEGDKYRYESPQLQDGFNVLVGENGSGKSTFANLIYFGLGGRVEEFRPGSDEKHPEIASDSNNYVELLITIDKTPFTLKRFFGTNDIGVSGDDELLVLPLNRGEGRQYIFSDWLLDKLGITPVVLQYGTYTGKLNFTDLARLIYHDQAPDPSGIFKSVDNSSFVSDSRVFRKAIFEILIGKSFIEYYALLAKFRDADRKQSEAQRSLNVFKEMVAGIDSKSEDLNIVFIDKKLTELREQQVRLEKYREQLTKKPPTRDLGEDLSELQRRLIEAEMEISLCSRREHSLMEELEKFEQLKSDLMLEATQLKKMMFANETLGLFNANTCPYCLNEVERVPNSCICGKHVGEREYEKFFYNTNDYLAILRSKQKNVETLSSASSSVRSDLESLRDQRKNASDSAKQFTLQIKDAVSNADVSIDLRKFDESERKLADVRSEIASLEQQRELEKRRDTLEKELHSIQIETSALRIQVNQLESQAEADIKARRDEFSEKYNVLMQGTIKDCRSASIDSDYMPVLNGGEYKEKSATVSKRLLYFGTLLYMSVNHTDVAFPRFLLVDTPETAGIDAENLENAIEHVVSIVKDGPLHSQVIMTTGVGKYPDSLSDRVFGTLRKIDGAWLLKRKPEVVDVTE